MYNESCEAGGGSA